MPEDTYSNPLAPDHDDTVLSPKAKQHPLKNADFRKLLMTPRPAGVAATRSSTDTAEHSQSFTHRPSGAPVVDVGKRRSTEGVAGTAKKHQPKKKPHFKPKKTEDEDELDEILKKYRDRAKERREGEDQSKGETDLLQLTAGYRAMGPDARSTLGVTELRKQLIQESKYLGGDMEHTHLVKGLDYSLLQKVRSEIVSKEKEEEELEKTFQSRRGEREEIESQMKSIVARNIYRILFKEDATKVNELFAPRRMAYVIELDDDYTESDIPTTLVRSKQDCPIDEATTNLSTNDMVIQKLTQVLAYLRTDTKRKKKEKGEKVMAPEEQRKAASANIYDDAGAYVPDTKKRSSSGKKESDRKYFEREAEDSRRDRGRDRDREGERRRSDRDRRSTDRHRERDRRHEHKDRRKDEVSSRLAQGWAPADLSLQKQQEAGYNPAALTKEEKEQGMGSVFKRERDPLANTKTNDKQGIRMSGTAEAYSYAECYPGGYEAFDAANDSDEDADFSKMDMGNKKGPIRRWDFETENEYEDYMSKREAMPKAAFQYGVKMNEGRKTRKMGSGRNERDEKQKIDRQWDQISRIISKRTGGGDAGGSESKKPKY